MFLSIIWEVKLINSYKPDIMPKQLWLNPSIVSLQYAVSFYNNLYFCFLVGRVGPQGPRGPPGPPAFNISLSSTSAFSVSLGEHNISSEKIIHFRHVISNKQNHYNSETGVFTCFVPGVYQFSFLCTSVNVGGEVNLLRNGVVELFGFSGYQGDLHIFSGEMVLLLEVGDRVWLEATEGITGLSPQSFFLGHLSFPAWCEHCARLNRHPWIYLWSICFGISLQWEWHNIHLHYLFLIIS